MSGLQARVERDGEIMVVRFHGRIDIESAHPFRQACRTHLKNQKVVFDFHQLNFVGSAGILPFLEAMQEFATLNPNGIKFSGIGVEFERVLSATSLQTVERWAKDTDAVDAYRHPQSAIQAAYQSQPNTAASGAIAAPLLSLSYEKDDREAGEPAADDFPGA